MIARSPHKAFDIMSPLKLRRRPKSHLFGRKEKEMNLYVEYVKEKTSVFNIQKEYEDAIGNKTQFEECLVDLKLMIQENEREVAELQRGIKKNTNQKIDVYLTQLRTGVDVRYDFADFLLIYEGNKDLHE